MTQRDPNDLADALAALAAGHHTEPEEGEHHESHDEHDAHAEHEAQDAHAAHEQSPPPEAPPAQASAPPAPPQPKKVIPPAPTAATRPPAIKTAPPPPARPAPPIPVADGRRPSAPIPARPVASAAPKTIRPSAPGNPPAAASRNPVAPPPARPRPTTPNLAPSDAFGPSIPLPPSGVQRPQMPPSRQPAPQRAASPRSASPVQPPPPAELPPAQPEPQNNDVAISSNYVEAVEQISTEDATDAQAATDDQYVAAPAPAPEVIAYRSPAAASKFRSKDPLFMRKTMIPLLLTIGVLLPIIAALAMTADSDTPLAQILPMGYCIGLIVGGLISLGLGAMNVLYVKQALEKAARQRRAARAV